MVIKQQVKNGTDKKKTACSLCFVNVFEFQEKKFKTIQRISTK